MLVGTVRIQGDTPNPSADFSDRRVKAAIERGVDEHMRWAQTQYKPYPPATAINNPPGVNGRWYVRGFGWRYVSGKSHKTSEMLSKSWGRGTEQMMNSIRGEVYNSASYADEVQGERQKRYHALRGWKKVSKVFETSEGRLQRTIEREVSKLEK